MTRKKIIPFVFILLLFIPAYIFLNRDDIFTPAKSSGPYEISVICRGKSSESWNTVKLGIDQAAKDFNADVSFITLSKNNSVSEQISLLSREIKNGADGIVIAPVNSDELKKPLEQTAKKVPVIAMQSTVAGMDGLRTVSCDNYRMGRSLAAELVKKRTGEPVVILQGSTGSSAAAESLRGVCDGLKQAGRAFSTFDMPNDGAASYQAVRQEISKKAGTVFVALDGETLETAARAKKDLGKLSESESPLYGIGITNTGVSLLEEKIISAVAVDNEYNIGYLCIKSAVDSINHQDDGNIDVDFLIVNHSNMYDTESEHMLFPFVR
ncbi:MAG: sugar ABC transporter substrate-binding protein [Clostridiales bacterium]|nr:sugar ABC transporter substrate-binding protein [Clostridiales bacterium]